MDPLLFPFSSRSASARLQAFVCFWGEENKTYLWKQSTKHLIHHASCFFMIVVWPLNLTAVVLCALPLLDRSLHIYVEFQPSSSCTLWNWRDNCPWLYWQWKGLGLCSGIFLSMEHNDLPFRDHPMCLTTRSVFGKDTSHCKMTSVPHSAYRTAGDGRSCTISGHKEILCRVNRHLII